MSIRITFIFVNLTLKFSVILSEVVAKQKDKSCWWYFYAALTKNLRDYSKLFYISSISMMFLTDS